jgi:CRP/FNR family transcriptional regulator, cyclic AMP receptor protein
MPKENSFLDVLGEAERRAVLTSMHRRRFARGEIIFHEGDPGDAIHILDRGHVAIRVSTPLGEVATLTVLGPGEAFGEGALLAPDSRRTASAKALEVSETRTLAGSAFERLRRDNPEVEKILTQVLARQVRRLSLHLVEALYVPSETRILRRLVALSESYHDDGDIVIPVTQDDVASMAGTSRPTANRVLKAAEQEGLLTVSRGRINIMDPQSLASRAR